MASSGRGAKDSVSSQLHAEPYRFSFVQAVRILEQLAAVKSDVSPQIGSDLLPEQECVRLAGLARRSFAPSEVVEIISDDKPREGELPKPAKLVVAFMGLFGPAGVLPHHDTQRIIDNGSKNTVERDFLDVFNHRLLSLFYRASVKYRLPIAYEASRREVAKGSTDNAVTRALYSLVGHGTGGTRGRLEIHDALPVEFSGVYAQNPKNPVSLARMLESVFEVQVCVQQHVGQWLTLSSENQSEMPTSTNPRGRHCSLGQSFILGQRVWDIASKFRICVGPLDKEQFNAFLPGCSMLVQLSQMVRLYVGNQFDFDVQLELIASAVPSIQLGESSRLGLDTWLVSVPPAENKTDTIFAHSGQPERRNEHAA